MGLVGQRIRNILVQKRIGSGGMGEVYLGFDETLERNVALKAIRQKSRLSLETKTRFLREARVLSQLEHPHICRIYDFLEHEGQEILVLEYVEGPTLSKARAAGLAYREKLVISIQLAEVLVAAHESGLIHRDLKPDNVIWTPDQQVKVLDFGLARPVASSSITVGRPAGTIASVEDSLDTWNEAVEMGVGVRGAPGSASEESASQRSTSGESASETSRQDFPAAEIVSGVGPDAAARTDSSALDSSALDSSALDSSALDSSAPDSWALESEVGPGPESDATRVDEPSLSAAGSVSISVSDLDSGTAISDVTVVGSVVGTVSFMSPEQARGEPLTAASDMYSLGIILHELFTEEPAYGKDLSAIVKLKRVSEGATLPIQGLGAELSELIRGLERIDPALRPRAVDAVERLRRIRDRPLRRRRQALAAGLLLALLGSGVKYTVDLEREQTRTLEALERAERARREAQQVSDFLVDVFEVSDPSRTRGQEITAREVLEEGAARLDELRDQPEIQARLLRTVGRVYYNLGLRHEAHGFYARAVETQRRLYPEGHLELATSLDALAGVDRYLDDYPNAVERYREALEMRRRLLPSDHPDLAESLGALGLVSYDEGRLEEARGLVAESIAVLRAAAAAGSSTADGKRALRFGEGGGGEGGLGEEGFGVGSSGKKRSGEKRSVERDPAGVQSGVLQSGALEDGASGPDPQVLAESLRVQGKILAELGELEQAESSLHEAAALCREALGSEHRLLATVLQDLGSFYIAQARFAEAETVLLESLAIREMVLDPADPDLAINASYLAFIASAEGNFAEAETLLKRSIDIFSSRLGPSHFNVSAALLYLGEVYYSTGRWTEARQAFSRSSRILEEAGLEDNYNAIIARQWLGAVYLAEGRWQQADQALDQSLDQFVEIMGEASEEVVETLLLLRESAVEQGRTARAEVLLERALVAVATLHAESPENPDTLRHLAMVRLAEGATLARAGDTGARAKLGEAAKIVQNLPGADLEVPLLALRAEAGLWLGEDVGSLLARLDAVGWASPRLWRLAAERIGFERSG